MIEITISKEGEVKIKVDNQAQSVSISGSDDMDALLNTARLNIHSLKKLNYSDTTEDCKRQNICGYDPKNYQNKPGCKSGEIEGGPTY